jgi:hypothetical protein
LVPTMSTIREPKPTLNPTTVRPADGLPSAHLATGTFVRQHRELLTKQNRAERD